MIRKLIDSDYFEVYKHISQMNELIEYNSSYMTTNKDILRNDIRMLLKEGHGLISFDKEHIINGVITYYQYNKGLPVFDISGPYVEDNLDLSVDLINELKKHLGDDSTLNFFFNADSEHYKMIMREFRGTFNGYEYILRMDKSSFSQNTLSEITTRKAIVDDFGIVDQIHKDTFGQNIYLKTETMFKSGDLHV